MISNRQSESLLETAKSMTGAKWHWRGWKPRDGKVDCLFATFWLLFKAGIVEHCGAGRNYYSRTAGTKRDDNLAEKFITTVLHVKRVEEPRDGDIVIFKAGRQSSHMGVMIDGGIAHVVFGKQFGIDPLGQWQKFVHCYLRVTSPKYKTLPSQVEIDQL